MQSLEQELLQYLLRSICFQTGWPGQSLELGSQDFVCMPFVTFLLEKRPQSLL